MPLNTRVAATYNYSLAPRNPVPIIRGWNRLEGRPRCADFERSLRAEVRDPLWFLTRQWQYGEFEGEDAGSPIDARIAYTTAPLDGFAVGSIREPYNSETPLEVTVTREVVPFDLTLHMQAARVFERLLRARNVDIRLKDYIARFPLIVSAVAGVDTDDAAALLVAGKAFLFDADALIGAVHDGSHAGIVSGFPGIVQVEINALDECGVDLVDWFKRTYGGPRTAPSTWRADRLGYAFGCSASGVGMDFVAEEFRGGPLDWYAFNAAAAEKPGAEPAGVALSFLPTSIQFAGMPSPRYWEIENSRTEFGHLDVHTNDLAKLVLAEFMLIYSNDWCLLPLELGVGSFTRVQGILVTDVFGDQTIVRAADRGRDEVWQRWSMFRMSGDNVSSPGLLLAPALTATITAPVMEEVHFLRDEMANMVWAVERRVMSRLGEAIDPSVGKQPAIAAPTTTAPTRYQLGTDVPPNWRPFIPTHLPGSTRSIRLQRARLPDQPLQTAGAILRIAGPYFLAEEEVPRAGRIVNRAFKRARWIDGTTFLWIGRRSTTGRGEGSSGLGFDQIVEAPLHAK